MKLSEIRALTKGTALLTLDGRRVTYVGTAYGPSATHRRATYAVVQNGDGSRSMEAPANLTPASTETAVQAEDLAVRIERQIFAAMKPDPTTRAGRTLSSATCKVAEEARDEARAKGWEPHQVRALGTFTAKVGAAIGRRTGEQATTDMRPELPEPTDVQVATAHPEVAAYVAAAIAAGKAGYTANILRGYLEECRRRVTGDSANHREIRDSSYRRWREAADAHDRAVNAMAAAEAAAHEVAPAATVRARLSMDAYAARLHQEREAHRRRRSDA